MNLNIINSLQPQAIGDAISAFPLLWELSQAQRLFVYFSCTAVRPLCNFATTSDEPLDGPILDIQDFARAAQMRGLHLVQSWFWHFGMPIPQPPFEWPRLATRLVSDHFDVAIAPFTRSEPERAWPPRSLFSNVWPLANWTDLCHSSTRRVCLLCSAADDVSAFHHEGLHILAGRDLPEVCGVLQNTGAVVTIDNGISWLAQAMRRPHVLLKSARHFGTWNSDLNPDAVNLENSVGAATVLDRVDRLLEGRPLPVESTIPLDRKIARLALLNSAWFVAQRDHDAATASYRVWRQHATPAQVAVVAIEVLTAIGQLGVSGLRRWSSKRRVSARSDR